LQWSHAEGLHVPPIYALTANVAHGQKEGTYRSIFRDVIAKPLRIDIVDGILQSLLIDKHPEAIKDEKHFGRRGAEITTSSNAFDTDHLDEIIRAVGHVKYLELLSSLQQQLQHLYQATQHRSWDPEALRNCTEGDPSIHFHRLAGSAATLGCIELSRICQLIEETLLANDREGKLPLLREEWNETAIHVRTEIMRLGMLPDGGNAIHVDAVD
jgi:HPt (histidine-containing phosphotransfer) domain-containing protein